MKTLKTFAERLTYALKLREMSQKELAKKADMKPQNVSYLCREGQGSSKTNTMAAILRVNPKWLESGEGDMEGDIGNDSIYDPNYSKAIDNLVLEVTRKLEADKASGKSLMEEELLHPTANFDATIGLSTPENLLSQSTFGHIHNEPINTSPDTLNPEPLSQSTSRSELPIEWLIEQTGLTHQTLGEMISAIRGDSPQIILAGPPGTGKTWVARQLAYYLTRGDEQGIRFVQFHPSYSYEAFMEGLRPVSRGVGISFEVTNGLVLDFVKNMRERGVVNDTSRDHVIVIDEANRANLPKVLGELMFLFEYREQQVRLQYSGNFSLPPNLRFIATMNTADRSIRSIDVALRRRFDVFELGPNPDILHRHYESERQSVDGLVEGFINLNKVLENELDRHHTIGHSFFMRERMDNTTLRQIWKRRVFPLIEEFFFDRPELAKEFRVEKFWPAANAS